jgi:D-hexose-6-phosphate mutarotase
MYTIQDLNMRFTGQADIQFRQPADGVIVMDVDNVHATASISLYGGQVLLWQPKCQVEPVLWISKSVMYKTGKAIRGGVPICWPWFGANPVNPQAPSHGYARIAVWDVESIHTLDDGATEVNLAMVATDVSRRQGEIDAGLSICITIGAALTLSLTTRNTGVQPLVLTEGLHTYFRVGDVTAIQVHGLNGGEYVDLLRNNLRCTQFGPVVFEAELGRIFVNSEATCVIEDALLKRSIRVEKAGSLSTAVWNPWTETAGKMDDLGADGWRDMVCVESANALENYVTVPPGGAHTLTANYAVDEMS